MAWYWWALIGIGCLIIAFLKIKVFGKMMEKRNSKHIEED